MSSWTRNRLGQKGVGSYNRPIGDMAVVVEGDAECG